MRDDFDVRLSEGHHYYAMTDAKLPPNIQKTMTELLARQIEIYLQAIKDLTEEADAVRKDEAGEKIRL